METQHLDEQRTSGGSGGGIVVTAHDLVGDNVTNGNTSSLNQEKAYSEQGTH